MTKKVLSVGQCGPDTHTLRNYISSRFDAEVIAADLADDAFEALARQSFDLVLVNRKLDADYSDGLDVIRAIKAADQFRHLPVMLVTNYPEHQAEAVACGAEPGFGKLEYHKPETEQRLARFLGSAAQNNAHPPQPRNP